MNNPLLKSVLANYPDVDAAALPWPDGAETWEVRDLDLFIGSGGFLLPKKKKKPVDAAKASSPAAAATASGGGGYPDSKAKDTPSAPQAPSKQEESQAPSEVSDFRSIEPAFERPGFDRARYTVTMPVRVHCEDTTPLGHARMESLVAFSERIRSLALMQQYNMSLADLREREGLAILATEYVAEIVGKGVRVMDTLRIDTAPEFPAPPLFPWDVKMYQENGDLYLQGLFALNLCKISDNGQYAGCDQEKYDNFCRRMKDWINPDTSKRRFDPCALRFFNAFPASMKPFVPLEFVSVSYRVRGADCDLYNVLFQARVTSMIESCHPRQDLIGIYVNIMNSVRPGFELTANVFHNKDSALFLFTHSSSLVLTAFAHYGEHRPMSKEEIKCASQPGITMKLLKFAKGETGPPPPSEAIDLSQVKRA